MTVPRRAPALALVLMVVATALAVLTHAPSAEAAIKTDPRLGAGACALTGRVYVQGSGCARVRCLPGATIFKAGKDAELCQKRGRTGAEYARPISKERCEDLGRIWIGQVNSCASNANRARPVIVHAKQCRNRNATYLNHREEEGYYDECVSPANYRKLTRIAKKEKSSVNKAASDRNAANCSYRPGWVMVDGTCVVRQGPVPAGDQGGFYVVGDSVSWRSDSELAARKRDWILDLRPGRRLDELPGRLDWFRANHDSPDQLIVQLGTNRRQGFTEDDFRTTMATIPDDVPVLFLLPYRARNADNAGPVRATRKYGKWMQRLAADRPLTCLGDWPKVAAANPERLVDGEHPGARSEGWYARYLIRAWDTCASSLGL